MLKNYFSKLLELLEVNWLLNFFIKFIIVNALGYIPLIGIYLAICFSIGWGFYFKKPLGIFFDLIKYLS